MEYIPLHESVKADAVLQISALLDAGVDVNEKQDTVDGYTLLHSAVETGNKKIVKMLLKAGADVNKLNNHDEPALLCALAEENHLDITKMLVKAGAKVDVDKYSFLLVQCACRQNKTAQVRHLMKHSLLDVLKMFVSHIAKLQALNLPVHAVPKDRGFNSRVQHCMKELEKAKSKRLRNSWVTFFNLLVDSKNKLKNYAGNKDLIEDFEKSNCLKKFPIYGAEMVKNVEKGVERRKLYDESALLLSDCLPTLNPTHLIVRDTLDCLPTKDLQKFCA